MLRVEKPQILLGPNQLAFQRLQLPLPAFFLYLDRSLILAKDLDLACFFLTCFQVKFLFCLLNMFNEGLIVPGEFVELVLERAMFLRDIGRCRVALASDEPLHQRALPLRNLGHNSLLLRSLGRGHVGQSYMRG
jgi:hypothetical protein